MDYGSQMTTLHMGPVYWLDFQLIPEMWPAHIGPLSIKYISVKQVVEVKTVGRDKYYGL